MRKKISNSNPLVQHVQAHSSIYLFIITLFLMGIIFGAIVVNSLSFAQKEDLYFYLSKFFSEMEDGSMTSAEELFRQSFLHNVKYLGLMWLLGISIIGLPLIFVLLFMKGVVVGFSVGFLVNQMGWSGFLLSFVSVLPQNIIIIPAFIFIGAISANFSLTLIRKIFMRQSSSMQFQMIPFLSRYVIFMVVAIGIVTVAASIEAYLSPTLMEAVIGKIK
ncbi:MULTISPECIES: stage II sporulation protein M [Rossellomorea]|jgi:stage II sporulation protein M|uniref:Stage II sporulation protein M n=2 Tax=Rossellomorea vietnamensis TaxID=218284 RepID=A0ACD4C7F7_9BACI|nr:MULTISPECIES: stage II sporulation protein M [Rossellomorea]OXS58613.1 stage II sporulation protein M [Bacillus sp. DSM 27956]PRX75517.1 stage II sporulation protein M [Bacillus sp. V-88]MCA0147736.1 stage II sporulation protein M [Rossellomorea vietnamensis]MCC5800324.1 stage II sporulation protein M [Rossellomorea vietnamensis]QHE62069.1 stage II sporulation protein M [Rossellomorea vietnamensis]